MTPGVPAGFFVDPARAVVLSDFDGTLSAIVDDPATAVPLDGVLEVLDRLSARYGLVGVVSGRPAAYLVDRLGPVAARLTLRGLYGLERVDDGRISAAPGLDGWRRTLGEVADQAAIEAPDGVGVERKGLAVTLHVRNAPDAVGWMEHFVRTVAVPRGLGTHAGRMSVELRPPVELDKGTVVRELGAGRLAACFLGDDRGDLPAFAGLADLRREGTVTLAVAVRSPEAPAELLAGADVVVDGPSGALALLVELADGRSA